MWHSALGSIALRLHPHPQAFKVQAGQENQKQLLVKKNSQNKNIIWLVLSQHLSATY